VNTKIPKSQLTEHPIVSKDEWIVAGAKLLAKEKEFTHLSDEMSALRRSLPWVRVKEDYDFEGLDGPIKLSELFDGKSQLIVYHCMWGPDDHNGCNGCSMICDHIDSARLHFEHHDIAIAVVSRGSLAEFTAFKKRMGWTFRWVSSAKSTFNYDYSASFHPEDLQSGDVLYNFKLQNSAARSNLALQSSTGTKTAKSSEPTPPTNAA
jgi:predicted dithiol-disulfide oxidoreductase (DUF899 family)